jgi:hypothetical protein
LPSSFENLFVSQSPSGALVKFRSGKKLLKKKTLICYRSKLFNSHVAHSSILCVKFD